MTEKIPDFGNPEEVEKWLNDESKPTHKFIIYGIEGREFTVRSRSNTSAGINVPADWMGKKVMVVRLE